MIGYFRVLNILYSLEVEADTNMWKVELIDVDGDLDVSIDDYIDAIYEDIAVRHLNPEKMSHERRIEEY